jgi:alpha-amylase
MKKKSLILMTFVMIILIFIGCNSNQTTTTEPLIPQEPTVESGYLVDKVQDGTILHAWNWSMNTVEENLEAIAIAGFSTVQISPMQPQKDYFGIGIWSSQWWKLYQPLGFSIATENHSLGTKADLESLTEAASEYGIKIIVDVVVNHLAGGDNETLNENVIYFEAEIYNQNLIRENNGFVSDSSVYAVTRGALGGFPDLQTESEIVQERVLALLKEYVDVGVAGFRFDAAKHIETPNDGEYASDFWPFVINGVSDYAESLGKPELYFYGEILNTAGYGRAFSDYTDYMSITVSEMSDRIRQAVISKNPSNVLLANYPSGVEAEKSVLWAESHDTFGNDNGPTKNTPDNFITKAYAIAASRKAATSLYFARPSSNTFMGALGSNTWQSLEVSAVNRFHNYFVDSDEFLSAKDGFFITERYSENKAGLIVIDLDGGNTVKRIPVVNIPDGSYHDQIGGTTFTVKNGQLSGSVGESGIAVIYNNPYEPKPVVYVSDDGTRGSFTSTKSIGIFSYNTTEAYYSINGGEKQAFSGNIDIELSHPDNNAIVTLDLEVWYKDYLVEKQYTYVKSNIVVTSVVVNDINTEFLTGNKIVAWTWEEGKAGKWVEGTFLDNTFTFYLEPGDGYFLLVIFPDDLTEYNWDSKIAQTNDVEIPFDGIYDGSTLIWN